MSQKKERSHGEQMNTLGEVTARYDVANIIMEKINKLNIIIKEDERKEKENKNAE